MPMCPLQLALSTGVERSSKANAPGRARRASQHNELRIAAAQRCILALMLCAMALASLLWVLAAPGAFAAAAIFRFFWSSRRFCACAFRFSLPSALLFVEMA